VGLGLSSCLIEAGASVQIVARPAAVTLLRAAGLRRGGIFGAFTAPPSAFACAATLDEILAQPAAPAEPPSQGVALADPFDFILICVKSFDTVAAARDLARHPALRAAPTSLVLCQNGWGNREAFLDECPGAPLYSARVITGFSRPRANEVEITVHADAMHLGALGSEPLVALEPLCAALIRGGLPCAVTPHIERDLWAKMLCNCSLNPLGALFDVPYGALAGSVPTRAIMNAVHEEIFRVLRAAGLRTHWPDAAAYQADFYARLVPATAAHCSSTLQDIRAGKRTEIEALSGAIVALARRHALPVPVNETLYQMVKYLEARATGQT